jgi:hypothetical protein
MQGSRGRCSDINSEDSMAGIKRSARKTVRTATEAVMVAAAAVKTARKAYRIAKRAGSEGKGVAKKVADRVTGRTAARRKKVLVAAAGAAAVTVATGVAIARVRKARKR